MVGGANLGHKATTQTPAETQMNQTPARVDLMNLSDPLMLNQAILRLNQVKKKEKR